MARADAHVRRCRVKPVTSYPAHGVDNGAENQLTAFVDRAGYVVGGRVTREKGAGVMKRPDFPAPEIVIAPGDEWGRTVLETKGKAFVVHQQTEIARDVEHAALQGPLGSTNVPTTEKAA